MSIATGARCGMNGARYKQRIRPILADPRPETPERSPRRMSKAKSTDPPRSKVLPDFGIQQYGRRAYSFRSSAGIVTFLRRSGTQLGSACTTPKLEFIMLKRKLQAAGSPARRGGVPAAAPWSRCGGRWCQRSGWPGGGAARATSAGRRQPGQSIGGQFSSARAARACVLGAPYGELVAINVNTGKIA